MTDTPEAVADRDGQVPGALAGERGGEGAARQGPVPERAERSALIEQMGGVRGLVDSGLPALVFVTVNTLSGLRPAVISAVVCGAAVFVLRLARRQTVQHAVSGFLGLAFAAFIAARTGRAEGFFLPGIVMNFVYATALVGSVVARRPLVGLAAAALEGRPSTWRDDARVRRVYARATIGWAVYFVVRAVIAIALYDAGSPVGLLVLKLSGVPTMILAVVATVAYTRRVR
ncbi:MAG: DUF3159 domain-containing protein [Actinomycetota bacterium]|nr:DUF3159 domain-containing protein [Actinomycetota bacterium]